MVVAVASGVVFWMSLSNDAARQAVEEQRNRSLEIVISANAVETAIIDRQRMVRGMVIRRQATGDDADAGLVSARASVSSLKALVKDNPVQAARAHRLSILVEEQQNGVGRTLAELATGDNRDASNRIVAGVGESRVDEVRQLVGHIVADERAFLRNRREVAARMARDNESYTYAIALVGLLIVVLAGTAVSMSVRGVWADRMREMEVELAAQRARASERMRIAQMATGAGTWDHDAKTGRTEWTAEMLNLYDRSPSEGPPSRAEWLSIVHPDDVAIATWTRPDGVGDASFETTFRVSTRSGSWRWIASRGYADARIGTGIVIGMDVDVTEQVAAREELEAVRVERAAEARVREAEEAVRQMQKMETVGQMTGGIAHDFNNMLTPIVGYLDMLQRRHGDDPRTARMLNMAMQSADRAKTLVSKLLSFSRRQQLDPKVVDAAALVHDMREFVSKAIAGSGVEVSVEPSESPLCVRVDPNQLENVILNLAVNARDAMPDGGIVSMSVARVGGEGVHVRPHGLAPGNYVVITVRDEGVGMDAETLRRAIEPFYTTKGTGKGTGLGLSMAHGMAGQSGGALELRSSVGKGTTAAIWLPEADASGLCPGEPDAAEPMVKVAPSRILLVDDDENVRRSISQMLSDLGHDVVEASSGAEALGRVGPDDGFDMLVTDYLMPSMTGVELLKKVRSTHPMLPVVVVSGYTAMADHDRIEGVARLAKPFTAARLSEAMGKVATRPRSGTIVDIGMGRPRG